MKDPYSVLGVAAAASEAEIKKAYRKLASQHHPDRGGNTAVFQEIQTAYDVLSDPKKKNDYDNPRQSSAFGFRPGQHGFDLGGIFDNLRAQQRQAQNTQRIRVTLWVNLEDIVGEKTKTINIATNQGNHTIEIAVPGGVEDNMNVQYPGLAPSGRDLFVTFKISPHKGWHREGMNLIMDCMVSIWDLILGSKLEVQTLHKQFITVSLPRHTQPGTMFRVCGKGLPGMHGGVGDLLIRVQAKIPDLISDEILKLIEQSRK